MSGPKHTPWTPGPWRVGGDGPALWVEGPNSNRNVICDIVGRQENGEYDAGLTDEDEANAQLIAAAPRLAEALKHCVKVIEGLPEDALGYDGSGGWPYRDELAYHLRAALREAGSDGA